MKQKYGKKTSCSNVIPFVKNLKKNDTKTTSTIAAILAIKVEHPIDISPEDFLIDQIETFENIEILAFEDALENDNIGLTTNEAQNEAANDA